MCKFFIEPPRIHSGKKDRERGKEKGRERGIWVVVCCYLLCTAPLPTFPPPCTAFHLPEARVIRTRGTGESPPATPLPLWTV